jgi:hypothetical protein
MLDYTHAVSEFDPVTSDSEGLACLRVIETESRCPSIAVSIPANKEGTQARTLSEDQAAAPALLKFQEVLVVSHGAHSEEFVATCSRVFCCRRIIL